MRLPLGLRTRLVIANLVVVLAALGSVVVGVGFVGPGHFAEAMGHEPGDAAGMAMDAATLAAFQDAVRTALIAATIVAFAAAVVVALAVSTRIAGPVTGFAHAARRIASGRYAERVATSGPAELAELASSFNIMTASLEATERRRLRLVGDVAHELRTPLTTLDGYLEGLEDGVVDASPKTWQLLRRETGRLTRLVDDLQQLWRAESGQLALQMDSFEISDVVQQVVERYTPTAAAASIAIRTDLPPGIVVRADRDRLAQIVDNYLSNAVRYAPPDSTVDVACRLVGVDAVLSVQDHGPGLTPEQRNQVFERFYRVDASRSRAMGGSGIGLSIVRALAEAMGGRVWAESSGPGQGSTFSLALRVA